jgi:hypothetical protein
MMLTLLAVAFVPAVASASRAVAPPPSCTHLVVATSTVEGADGAGYATVLFVNTGATCELEGYPTVKFFVTKASHLIGHDIHHASMVFAEPSPHRVILARGVVASVGVTWQDDPQPHQSCSTASWINVVLPGPNRENYQPSINAKPCGSNVWVTNFESGARPRFTWNEPSR